MEADDFNSLYQKAFALALKSQAGVEQKDLDDGKSFFFPTKNTNTRILPASRHMPVALTNDYLFLEADYLYKPNEEYRQGTGSRSYVRRLVQYMRDARPADRDLTEEEKKKRRALREELEDAENDFLKAQEKAEARWQKEHDAKPSQTPDFSTWARANAAVFLSVHSDYRGIAARYSAFQIGILGDENWKREHDKLVQALNATEYSPSITMKCKGDADATLALDLIEKGLAEGKVDGPTAEEPPDKDVIYRPAYTIDPGYRSAMDRWLGTYNSSSYEGEVLLDLEKASKTSWREFGFKETGGGGGISFFGLFRIGAKGSSSESYDRVKVNEKKHSVNIKLRWKKMQLFNVYPGSWNVPDAKKMYPKSESSEDDELWIRPTQFLCASGFSVVCEMGKEESTALDEKIQKQISVSGSGSVRIGLFGFDAGPSYSKSDGVQTSTYDWDKSAGRLTINPTPTFGYSVLLGVRGEPVYL